MEDALFFKVRSLCKTFPNGYTALKDIDLDIRRGECLVIAGANGSGKTVLTRILAGLLESDSGKIFFNGEPLEGALKNPGSFRRSLGIVFQDADAQFVGETVEEDAAFGPENLGADREAAGVQVRAALEKTGLWEKRSFPPRRLSGGEKRRLAVAGVLAMTGFGGEHKPARGIIMDEPFANLDWPGVVQTLEIITSLKQEGMTLLILTHELEKVLALSDRLVILDRGRICEAGKPEAVLDRLSGEYGVRDPRHQYKTVEDCSWLR